MGVARADGGDVTRELVLSAHLISIRNALICAMLAGESTISIFLGVSLGGKSVTMQRVGEVVYLRMEPSLNR